MLKASRREFIGLSSVLPFVNLFVSKEKVEFLKHESIEQHVDECGIKFIVYFRPNTEYNYGVRAVVNHPFLRSRTIPIRLTHGPNENIYKPSTIEIMELFIKKNLVPEVPSFFVGELRKLSPRIQRVQRV